VTKKTMQSWVRSIQITYEC